MKTPFPPGGFSPVTELVIFFPQEQKRPEPREEEEIEEVSAGNLDVLAAYLADGAITQPKPVYCEELGLAVEKLKDGYTIDKLWEVIPS